MKKFRVIILFLGWIVLCVFALYNLFKNQNNGNSETVSHRTPIVRQGTTAIGSIVSVTQIDISDEHTFYEFLVQKASTDHIISVVQTNELDLKPGDNVILVTIDGHTRIRAKY